MTSLQHLFSPAGEGLEGATRYLDLSDSFTPPDPSQIPQIDETQPHNQRLLGPLLGQRQAALEDGKSVSADAPDTEEQSPTAFNAKK